MPYATDENGNHIFDENNEKIEYNIEHHSVEELIKYKEPLHINDDGHLDTEDRHIIIKEAINDNHAVCKKQLDNAISNLQILLNNTIQNLIKQHEAKILTQMFNFRNEQIKNRIGRFYGKIPKQTHKVHTLINSNDINNIQSLKEVIITAIFIKRYTWYYNLNSSHCQSSFNNSFENMYSGNFDSYNCYFTHYNDKWSYDFFIEYIIIPKPISYDNENISVPKPENNSNE